MSLAAQSAVAGDSTAPEQFAQVFHDTAADGPFDWRPNVLIAEDMLAAPAPDGTFGCRSLGRIKAELDEACREGKGTPEMWRDYHERKRQEEARRDAERIAFGVGAEALAERLGRLPGVIVESTEVDDFGRVEFKFTLDGACLWSRPVRLDAPGDYKALRDAIAARRRDDWQRARRWTSSCEPYRRVVNWDVIDRVRFGENGYGAKSWL